LTLDHIFIILVSYSYVIL